jgi:hypothetical protein
MVGLEGNLFRVKSMVGLEGNLFRVKSMVGLEGNLFPWPQYVDGYHFSITVNTPGNKSNEEE